LIAIGEHQSIADLRTGVTRIVLRQRHLRQHCTDATPQRGLNHYASICHAITMMSVCAETKKTQSFGGLLDQKISFFICRI